MGVFPQGKRVLCLAFGWFAMAESIGLMVIVTVAIYFSPRTMTLAEMAQSIAPVMYISLLANFGAGFFISRCFRFSTVEVVEHGVLVHERSGTELIEFHEIKGIESSRWPHATLMFRAHHAGKAIDVGFLTSFLPGSKSAQACEAFLRRKRAET